MQIGWYRVNVETEGGSGSSYEGSDLAALLEDACAELDDDPTTTAGELVRVQVTEALSAFEGTPEEVRAMLAEYGFGGTQPNAGARGVPAQAAQRGTLPGVCPCCGLSQPTHPLAS